MLFGFWSRLSDPSGKRLFYRPSMIQSPAEQRRPKTDFSRPFSNIHGDAIERDWPIGRSVIALLLGCGPPAVFRAVVALTIDSVKTGSFWSLTHVRQKVLEIKPAVADIYPLAAISVIVRGGWTQASALHGVPRHKGWGLVSICAMAVLCVYVDLVASAGFNCARPKGCGWDDFSRTAITNAIPERSALGGFISKAFDNESSETLSGKVDMTTHGFTSIMVSNHLKVRNSGVIDVPFSVAKPSYASGV